MRSNSNSQPQHVENTSLPPVQIWQAEIGKSCSAPKLCQLSGPVRIFHIEEADWAQDVPRWTAFVGGGSDVIQ